MEINSDLITLPDECITNILENGDYIDKLMVYCSNRRFKNVSKYDHRVWTFRNAIKSESWDMVKYIENVKGKSFVFSKYVDKILLTKNLVMIKKAVSNSVVGIEDKKMFKTAIEKNSLVLLGSGSIELIYYLFGSMFSHGNMYILVRENRTDVLDYYYKQEELDVEILNNLIMLKRDIFNKINAETVIYLHKIGIKMDHMYLVSIFKLGVLEYVKWAFENFSNMEVMYGVKEFVSGGGVISDDIVYWLYERGVCVYADMYEYAMKTGTSNRLMPKDIEQWKDDRTIINLRELIEEAKNGVFELEKFTMHKKYIKSVKFSILFYAIMWNRRDIYNLTISSIKHIHNYDDDTLFDKLSIICEVGSVDFLIDYIYITMEHCYNFFEKYIDLIERCIYRDDVITVVLNKAGLNSYYDSREVNNMFKIAICYYKRGMKYLFSNLVNHAIEKKLYDKLDKDSIIYIYESNDLEFIQTTFDYVTISSNKQVDNLFKYCSLDNLTKLFFENKTMKLNYYIVARILLFEHVEVFRWYMKHVELDIISMYCGITRFPYLNKTMESLGYFRMSGKGNFKIDKLINKYDITVKTWMRDRMSSFYFWVSQFDFAKTNDDVTELLKERNI